MDKGIEMEPLTSSPASATQPASDGAGIPANTAQIQGLGSTTAPHFLTGEPPGEEAGALRASMSSPSMLPSLTGFQDEHSSKSQ